MLTDYQKMRGLEVAEQGGDVGAVALALARAAPSPVMTQPIDMGMQIVRPTAADFMADARALVAAR
jgi:hypothetical protein